MKAIINFDENKYINYFQTDNVNGEWEVDDETFEFGYLFCYKLENNKLVLDEEKKAKQKEEEEKQDETPTWYETIDSQVFYTAMMTDTLIEE